MNLQIRTYVLLSLALIASLIVLMASEFGVQKKSVYVQNTDLSFYAFLILVVSLLLLTYYVASSGFKKKLVTSIDMNTEGNVSQNGRQQLQTVNQQMSNEIYSSTKNQHSIQSPFDSPSQEMDGVQTQPIKEKKRYSPVSLLASLKNLASSKPSKFDRIESEIRQKELLEKFAKGEVGLNEPYTRLQSLYDSRKSGWSRLNRLIEKRQKQ